MNKLCAVLIAVFLIFALSACSFEEETLITSQSSPNGNYTVCLYQVGSPQWSFGAVKAKLVLKDGNGTVLDEVNFSLANDGTGVYVDNIKQISWSENRVEISMREFDTTRQFAYVLSYTD